MTQVPVEILFAPGCAHVSDTRELVEKAARREGVPVALEERVVETLAEARERRFVGSPTVRVAGRDVEPGAEAREVHGLSLIHISEPTRPY